MTYIQEPGRGPLATFKNVTSLIGPTAEVCGPGGGEDCPKPYDTTKKKGGKGSSTKKDPRSRGTIERETQYATTKIPGAQVSVNQITLGGETGRIENQGKSVSDFKQEVTEAGDNLGIINTGIADRAAAFIKTPTEVKTDKFTTAIRRTNKGKAKIKVETKQAAGKTEGRFQSTPYDLTFRKSRLIGKDKVRKYTTESSRAQDSKQFGTKSDVKLVSVDKMRKLVEKAEKKLERGNPASIKFKKPKSSKKKSIYL